MTKQQSRLTPANPKLISRKRPKRANGFTLLELIIALALWMMLSIGVFMLWQHGSSTALRLMEHQSAFENARVSMDALIMNIQMSDNIILTTTRENVLRRIILPGPDTLGRPHNFRFDFNAASSILSFGDNEFASGIREIKIEYTESKHINITIQTTCEQPIILYGGVDARYKNITVNP
jgi:hypothetical protein